MKNQEIYYNLPIPIHLTLSCVWEWPIFYWPSEVSERHYDKLSPSNWLQNLCLNPQVNFYTFFNRSKQMLQYSSIARQKWIVEHLTSSLKIPSVWDWILELLYNPLWVYLPSVLFLERFCSVPILLANDRRGRSVKCDWSLVELWKNIDCIYSIERRMNWNMLEKGVQKNLRTPPKQLQRKRMVGIVEI